MRFKTIGIAVAMLCYLLLIGMVLTSSAFAQLAIEDHDPKNIDVWASVYLDQLEYDPTGGGVVYLDGSFGLYNMDAHRGCVYTFEVRLEIFKKNKANGKYDTLTPDARTNPLITGTLDEAAEPWENFDADGSDSKSLHISCLGGTHVKGDDFKAEATITLNVTQRGWTESWQIRQHILYFTHDPETDEEEIHGIGPTTDGDEFSDDCQVDSRSKDPEKDEGQNWQSLVITEIPYDVIYWYVKAPGDTSYYGTNKVTAWGDGAARRSTFTYDFPLGDGNDNTTGAYYQIGALVHRSDNEIKWYSYEVWVNDAPGHD